MKFALCDDNPNELRQIRDYLLRYNAQANWKGFASSEELLAAFRRDYFDIVLLDIEMPDINGMELARQLRDMDDDLLIIFTTSYPEYMHESFEVQPFQFITKPVDYTAIYKLFNNIIKKLYRNSKSIVIIDTDGEKNFVPLSDLLYISSMKENKLHLRYQLTD